MAGSNRYSKALVCVLCVAVLLAVPLVGAVTTTVEELPSEAEVGAQTNATVMLTDLYRNPNLEAWTLRGETELTDVTWTLTLFDQGGNQITTRSYDGQTFEHTGIELEQDVSEVAVKVTGTVPSVTAYSYSPPQSFSMMNLTQTRPGGTSSAIGSWSAHHFTQESRAAREAIDQANATIDSARADGANTDSAEGTLQDAIEAYETRSFNLATSLAEEAASEAESSQQNTQFNRWLLYGSAAVILIGAVVGAVYWYQNREESYDRLG